MRAVLASGRGAVLSFRSAAALHGLRPDNRAVTDVTTARTGLRPVNGIVRHESQTLTPRDVMVVRRIPCTSVARTLLDLAAVVDWQGVRRACSQAEVLRVFDKRQIDDLLARSNGHPGAPVLRDVLARGRVGEAVTRNDVEEAFLVLCARARLDEPRVQPLDRARRPRGAGRLPLARQAAHRQGRRGGSHDTHTGFQEDRRRDQALMAAGYRVVRFTWWQVLHAPGEVLAILAKLHLT